jgi:hypothetical protein
MRSVPVCDAMRMRCCPDCLVVALDNLRGDVCLAGPELAAMSRPDRR